MNTPDRFAQACLAEHPDVPAFTIAIPGDEESEAVARALEGLGCTVEPEPFDLQMRVTVPSRSA